MSGDEIRRLIGGYATGNLSEAQRKLLFDAALEDQDLFDELAREQQLKELIEAPGVKQRLLASLGERQEKVWWKHPLPWIMGGSALAVSAGLMILVFVTPSGSRPGSSVPTEVAQARPPVTAETPSSQPATPPEPRLRSEPDRSGAPVPPAATYPQVQAAQPTPENGPALESQNRPADSLTAAPRSAASPRSATSEATPAPAPPAPPPAVAGQLSTAEQKTAVAPPPQPAQQNPAQQNNVVPPQSATAFRDGAPGAGGASAGALAAPRALGARPAAPLARFAFDYSINDGVLRIVPQADGYLLVRAVVGPIDRLVLPTARLARDAPANLRVPDGATAMLILFSARPVQEDSTEDLATSAAPRTGFSGTVEDSRPSTNSRLAVRITVGK